MTFRRLRHDDVFELRTWHANKKMAARLCFPDDNWISYVTTHKNAKAYVLLHENDEIIGYLQVEYSDDGEGFIAFAIKPGEQQKGFGNTLLREFEQIIAAKLSIITAFVEPDNIASISLLKRRGFTTDNNIDKDGMLRFGLAIG